MRVRRRPPVTYVCKRRKRCIFVILHDHGKVCRVRCRCSACIGLDDDYARQA